MSRVDVEPRLSTYFKIGDFSFNPSITVGLTDYGKDYSSNSETFYTPASVITPGRNPAYGCGGYPACPPQVVAYDVAIQTRNLLRHDADFVLKMSAPIIERIFVPPACLHLGEKLKHVIEFNATYEDVSGISGVSRTGVSEVNRIIRLDSTDILSDTNQLSFDMTNRLYKKDKNGIVTEVLNWHLSYARYFDPTFGGAVVGTATAGQRNVILEALEMSPYTFFYEPRNYSPIESSLLVTPVPFLSFEYRSAYDPLQHKFIDHAISSTFRRAKFIHGLRYRYHVQAAAGPVGRPDYFSRRLRNQYPARLECRGIGHVRLVAEQGVVRVWPADLQHQLLRLQFRDSSLQLLLDCAKPGSISVLVYTCKPWHLWKYAKAGPGFLGVRFEGVAYCHPALTHGRHQLDLICCWSRFTLAEFQARQAYLFVEARKQGDGLLPGRRIRRS